MRGADRFIDCWASSTERTPIQDSSIATPSTAAPRGSQRGIRIGSRGGECWFAYGRSTFVFAMGETHEHVSAFDEVESTVNTQPTAATDDWGALV